MYWDIKTYDFWNNMIHRVHELYQYKLLHIDKMTELMKELGIEYVKTYLPEGKDPSHIHMFKFKIVDNHKLMVAKIKYGV